MGTGRGSSRMRRKRTSVKARKAMHFRFNISQYLMAGNRGSFGALAALWGPALVCSKIDRHS